MYIFSNKNILRGGAAALLIFAVLTLVDASWCTSNQDCGDTRYYSCQQNQCCKKSGLACGAGYSWSCCNTCKVPKYAFTGTCS